MEPQDLQEKLVNQEGQDWLDHQEYLVLLDVMEHQVNVDKMVVLEREESQASQVPQENQDQWALMALLELQV